MENINWSYLALALNHRMNAIEFKLDDYKSAGVEDEKTEGLAYELEFARKEHYKVMIKIQESNKEQRRNSMYFITCFSKCEIDEKGWLDTGATRVFGYKETFEEAERALNENHCDMHEYLYQYAILELIPAGIHATASERWFFKYDEAKQGFFEIEKPSEFNGGNVALG